MKNKKIKVQGVKQPSPQAKHKNILLFRIMIHDIFFYETYFYYTFNKKVTDYRLSIGIKTIERKYSMIVTYEYIGFIND